MAFQQQLIRFCGCLVHWSESLSPGPKVSHSPKPARSANLKRTGSLISNTTEEARPSIRAIQHDTTMSNLWVKNLRFIDEVPMKDLHQKEDFPASHLWLPKGTVPDWLHRNQFAYDQPRGSRRVTVSPRSLKSFLSSSALQANWFSA